MGRKIFKTCHLSVCVALLGAPVPGLRQNGGTVDKEYADPRVEIGARQRRAGSRGRCVPRKKEASPENQQGLGDKGTEGQSESRWLVGVGCSQKGPKGRPRQRDTILVMEQAAICTIATATHDGERNFFIYPVEQLGKFAGKNCGEKSRGKIAGEKCWKKLRGKIARKNRGENSRGKSNSFWVADTPGAWAPDPNKNNYTSERS